MPRAAAPSSPPRPPRQPPAPGRLPRPGTEAIGEVYYDWKPLKPLDLTADYQLVVNPGYNRDRGPAHVFALRLHGQF